jgi:hypothetical protein
MSGCAVEDTQCEKEKKTHFISQRHERESLKKKNNNSNPESSKKKGTQPSFRH